MIEVEIRARVEAFSDIKQKLLGAKFLGEKNQNDIVFGHSVFLNKDRKIIEGGVVARIRNEPEKRMLNFKEIYRDGSGFDLDMEISDEDIARNFLRKIGFKQAFVIKKKREEYSLNGFNICLDTVENLGKFIEIEKTFDTDEDRKLVKHEMIELLEKIAPEAQLEPRKYGDMLQEKMNTGTF